MKSVLVLMLLYEQPPNKKKLFDKSSSHSAASRTITDPFVVNCVHGLEPKWLHFGFCFLKMGRPALPGQARFRSFTLSRRTNVLLLERVLLSPMGHFPHIHSPQGKDHGVPIGKRGERERGRGQTNARRQHAGAAARRRRRRHARRHAENA
jgi:hypothetical protein